MRTAIAWVPLKEKSSRCTGKNWRPLGGKPLYCHVIDTLLSVLRVEQIVINVDTEWAEWKVSTEYEGQVVVRRRPSHLLSPTTSTVDLMLDDIESYPDESLWMMVHATVPFTLQKTFENAIAWFALNPRYDSVFAVTPVRERFYDGLGRAVNHNVHIQLPLQELPPLYQENNAFFLVEAGTARRQHNRIGQRPFLWEMTPDEGFDIDHEIDFTIAEVLYARARNVVLPQDVESS